jgi:hypothetical protein
VHPFRFKQPSGLGTGSGFGCAGKRPGKSGSSGFAGAFGSSDRTTGVSGSSGRRVGVSGLAGETGSAGALLGSGPKAKSENYVVDSQSEIRESEKPLLTLREWGWHHSIKTDIISKNMT